MSAMTTLHSPNQNHLLAASWPSEYGGGGLSPLEQVVLVELDPHMTRLFAQHPALVALNQGVLKDPRVQVVNADAYTWLEANRCRAAGERRFADRRCLKSRSRGRP